MMTCDLNPKLDVSLPYQAVTADSLQQRPLATAVIS
jgi:hypothetical protein